ncbi:MAG TPA: hypothetical protein PLT50_01070 [bacterium]|nr:hypothetical protein [bacterium]
MRENELPQESDEKAPEKEPSSLKERIVTEAIRQGTRNVEMFLDFLVDQSEKADEERIRRAYEVTIWGLTTITRAYVRANMERHCPPGVEFERNPEQRPFLDILKEGISSYIQETGQTVYVALPQYRVDTQEFARQLKEEDAYGNSTYKRVKAFIADGDTENAISLIRVLPCFKELYMDIIDAQLGSVMQRHSSDSKVLFVEEYFTGDNPKIGSAELFKRALELTQGDLVEALSLTYKGLRHACRETPNPTETSIDFAEHIKDEFSAYTPWDKLPRDSVRDPRKMSPESVLTRLHEQAKGPSAVDTIFYDFSLQNQVGRAYHAFNLAFLATRFSPEIIAAMVAGEYVNYGEKHGTYKLLGDLEILGGLYQIVEYFGTLPTKDEWLTEGINKALSAIDTIQIELSRGEYEALQEIEHILTVAKEGGTPTELAPPLKQLIDKFIEAFGEGGLANIQEYYPIRLVEKIAGKAGDICREQGQEQETYILKEIEKRANAILCSD